MSSDAMEKSVIEHNGVCTEASRSKLHRGAEETEKEREKRKIEE